MNTPLQPVFPLYNCHKQVRAVKITALEIHKNKAATIATANPDCAVFTTAPGWAERWKGGESDLGYFVVYADGYVSWSPTAAFEEGYSLA